MECGSQNAKLKKLAAERDLEIKLMKEIAARDRSAHPYGVDKFCPYE
jgi:hypothetical protein